MNLYHYTCGHKLAAIAESGALRPSAVPPWAPHEKAILWFSSNDAYELSAAKPLLTPSGGRFIDLPRLHAMAGLYRFVLRDGDSMLAMEQWPRIAVKAGMREVHRVALASAGVTMRAKPREWWGTLMHCPLEVLSLEYLAWPDMDSADEAWVPMTITQGIAQFRATGTQVASYSEHTGDVTHAPDAPITTVEA